MSKSAKKRSRNQDQSPSHQRTLRLAAFIQRNLYAFVIEEGMKAFDALLEQDREQLCGPSHAKGGPDDPVRWGTTDGRLVMGGRRISVKKPRVRQGGAEVELPSWTSFADEDLAFPPEIGPCSMTVSSVPGDEHETEEAHA